MVRRHIPLSITGILVLLLALFAMSPLASAHAAAASNREPATTINDLHAIHVVGSTQFILDANGHTISVDANPYGVAIAPPGTASGGTLQPGDIVVTNFGANDTGTTLVRFPHKAGPGHLFNTTATAGTFGPDAEAFSVTGFDWVANFTGDNVQIFTINGVLVATITNALFNKPWGQAFNQATPNPKDGSVEAFFSTNAGDGTIDRIDLVPLGNQFVFEVFQIGQLPATGTSAVPIVAPQGMAWVPTWTWGGKTYSDVLFVVDAAENRIAAYPNSSTRNTTSKLSTYQGITVFQGAPLDTPAGLAVNPINGDLLVVNQLNNRVVELNPSSGQVVGTRVLDKTPVNPKTGAGSALFGLVATTDAQGNLVIYFSDDLTNTLDRLSVS